MKIEKLLPLMVINSMRLFDPIPRRIHRDWTRETSEKTDWKIEQNQIDGDYERVFKAEQKRKRKRERNLK